MLSLLQMQSILYHNSSGAQAFTGNLKKKEVHRAITLHPVKSPPHMYRLHNYMRVGVGTRVTLHALMLIVSSASCESSFLFPFQGLQIQELQQERLNLHRDIHAMAKQLELSVENFKNLEIADGVPLFPASPHSKDYPGDTEILGKISVTCTIYFERE